MILILYVFYKDQIIYGGTIREYYIKYYFVLFLFLIIFFLTKFLNKKLKVYILIIFASIFSSIYLFEIYITFYPEYKKNKLHNKVKKEYFDQTSKDWDERTRFEIYKDIKKKNSDIKVSVGANSFVEDKTIELLPLSGVSNSLTINCNENGYYSLFNSDRFGFNNPDYEWSANEIEYLLLGDSYTLGSCVNRPKDIASSLRFLSKKNVINLGYHGNGPLIEYATLREYFPNKTKNIIILYFEENDLHELRSELKNHILNKYFIDKNYSQNLRFKQKKLNLMIEKKISIEFKKAQKNVGFSKFIKFFNTRAFFKSLRMKKINKNQDILSEFSSVIDKIHNLAKSNNSKLHFVYLPEFKRYSTKDYESSYLKIKKIIKAKDIQFIDIHEQIFSKHKDPKKLFSFSIENHYNEDAYYKIANLLKTLVK